MLKNLVTVVLFLNWQLIKLVNGKSLLQNYEQKFEML